MIDLSRRSFLFGVGAIIAAASVKLPEPVTQIPYEPLAETDRTYRDIYIGKTKYFDYGSEPVIVDIYRDDIKLLHLASAPNGHCNWTAFPGSEIYIPDYSFLKVSARGDTRDLEIHLIYADDKRKFYSESHIFDANGQKIKHQILSMHV